MSYEIITGHLVSDESCSFVVFLSQHYNFLAAKLRSSLFFIIIKHICKIADEPSAKARPKVSMVDVVTIGAAPNRNIFILQKSCETGFHYVYCTCS